MPWRQRVRRLLPYFVAACAGFVLAYLIVLVFVFPTQIVPDDATIPNVVGLPAEDAERRLAAAGFRMVERESRFHATVPPGTVLEQDPMPGGVEPERTRITLAVSGGPRAAEIPKVAGMTRQQAQVALENAGFAVGEVRTTPSLAPRGQVVASTPAAGERVALPAQVALLVSAGAGAEADTARALAIPGDAAGDDLGAVALPDVIGQALGDARAMLEQLGLRVVVRVDSASDQRPGIVASQSPVPGREVRPGTQVRLTISDYDQE